MSKYTRESPFEFEGQKVWSGIEDHGGHAAVFIEHEGGYTGVTPEIADAMHAFIEAEREPETHPIPEVGQWIKATLRNGEVNTFQVTGVRDKGRYYSIDWDGGSGFINKPDAISEMGNDILGWEPIEDEPEPVKTAYAIATVSVRLDLAGLADDLQAAADAVRSRLENGLHA